MNKKEFKEAFRDTLENMYNIMEKKNSDYSRTWAFWNFELVSTLWITSVEKWILVRMADKMSMISTLIDQEAAVSNEAITDTLEDLANYSIILKVYLESNEKKSYYTEEH